MRPIYAGLFSKNQRFIKTKEKVMSLNLKKFWTAAGMAAVLILPLFAHADSVTIDVNDRHRGYYDDNADYYNHFTWGIGLGGAVLGNGFGSNYSGGYGLDGNIGIRVDKNLSFLLAVDSYLFNTNNSNFYSGEVNAMPSIRVTMDGKDVKPYFILGAGVNENIAYYPTFFGTGSAYTTSPVVGGGVGLDFRVSRKLDIYIQGKYEDILASGGSFSYFPISAGVQFN